MSNKPDLRNRFEEESFAEILSKTLDTVGVAQLIISEFGIPKTDRPSDEVAVRVSTALGLDEPLNRMIISAWSLRDSRIREDDAGAFEDIFRLVVPAVTAYAKTVDTRDLNQHPIYEKVEALTFYEKIASAGHFWAPFVIRDRNIRSDIKKAFDNWSGLDFRFAWTLAVDLCNLRGARTEVVKMLADITSSAVIWGRTTRSVTGGYAWRKDFREAFETVVRDIKYPELTS